MIDDNYSSKIRQQKKINFQKKNNKNITTKIKGKETNLSNIYNIMLLLLLRIKNITKIRIQIKIKT